MNLCEVSKHKNVVMYIIGSFKGIHGETKFFTADCPTIFILNKCKDDFNKTTNINVIHVIENKL